MTDTPQCVLCLPPREGNPRNSEGSFVELGDGRLLYVYSHFTGAAHDDAEAHLASRFSEDQGQTWSREDVTVVANPPGKNVMSVSLLRLADGRIALFYLVKQSHRDWRVLLRVSSDETVSWSDAVLCSHEPGVYVMNNDRAVQLRSGRLVLPTAYVTPAEGRGTPEEEVRCLLSNDAGASWRIGQGQRVPGVWTQEPGVVERMDGRLMQWCRTQMGCQYVSVSEDDGESWTALQASSIVSSLSPASIKRIPQTGDLLMVWNPVPGPWPGWEALIRSPLSSAISRDEGATWENEKVIYHDPARWFCYAAIHFTRDEHVLLSHSASGGRGAGRLRRHQITRIPLTWLYG